MKHNFKDLSGQVFGYWTVLKIGDLVDNANPHYKYWCRCICGREKQVDSIKMKRGLSKSCGCMKSHSQRESIAKSERAMTAERRFWWNVRGSAKKRGLEFSLTVADVTWLMYRDCNYCGKMRVGHSGLDRVDSERGYTTGNCVPCCWKCNRAKNTMGSVEFAEWIDDVYAWQHR